ncbi:hypothetical protein Sgleb_16050 [Streptomyces glebosus]|uniref:Uncharacterized protein n=1 Tax=Streptomyces glebosus TaxID=249580 RepID=A0A640SR93_9ACTN|nr:hypothetical protein [Streptomyces glebosus]GFE13558.1 hypothetical protein Sgleb_16050 [Streptomyces glebosus]GHG68762.1 hypothetical protein GCM10010513_39450 [Streptomyces glebosus]
MRPSPADMQVFTVHQIEVGEPDPRWVRCELRYRHKNHHYASAEGVLIWWKRKHKRKRSRR